MPVPGGQAYHEVPAQPGELVAIRVISPPGIELRIYPKD